MSQAAALSSGKGHHDENFPVASVLISPRHRPAILAFYRFVRTADDVADHATVPPEEKLRLLEDMRLSLMGESDASPEGVALRKILAERGLTADHAADLLEAFRRDVTKLRYSDWSDLMDYCRYSAMPVGRYVLDVHGETRDTWPLSDALCAALQVINHLQDCGKDYRTLNRVYIPLDAMNEFGMTPEALGASKGSPALCSVVAALARRNAELLAQSAPFAAHIRDMRLGLEVSVIHTLARDLNDRLMVRDPLSERVHHRGAELPGLLLIAFTRFLGTRLRPKRAAVESTHS
ncbi:MAG: squalene synthase HpnC [Alphaproteobacteria bacterium]|nr:squalene synthase HpnC [Alphaproteobacteria bacterium]MDE1986781.1 squalene synthase HpnC [Alphaproteobacteria bacterium]MDE2162465.1 squalene synthase HpnC [Alphaproteobacteria bacterium]MDE2499180.1 squalene synthase HpnC [Alphaproteobacteria bacterium]